jgi:branched-chain amino acid transport system permease protein
VLEQQIISGLAVGAVYALVALGFIIIFKVTDVVNFAQGEMMMFGTFIAFSLLHAFKGSFLIAVPVTLVAAAALGIVMERFTLRPLIGAPLFTIVIVTIGLSMVLRSVAGVVWTHDLFPFPAVFSERPISAFGIVVTPLNLGMLATACVVMMLLYAFFTYTRWGTAMRAASENQTAAVLMGISLGRVLTLAWGISAMLAAIAGILVAPITNVHTNMGYIGIKAFAGAILGGFGSFAGAVVGSLVLGVMENLAAGYLPVGLREVLPIIVVLAVLAVRPAGIFGQQVRRRL